jgi:hypothetical protein
VGKVATFMDCELFLIELVKDRFLGVDPQDNMCRHVFGME